MNIDRVKTAAAMFGICTTLPIWYYLLYKILERVDATELMWFLFWSYVPIHLVVQLIARFVSEPAKSKA